MTNGWSKDVGKTAKIEISLRDDLVWDEEPAREGYRYAYLWIGEDHLPVWLSRRDTHLVSGMPWPLRYAGQVDILRGRFLYERADAGWRVYLWRPRYFVKGYLAMVGHRVVDTLAVWRLIDTTFGEIPSWWHVLGRQRRAVVAWLDRFADSVECAAATLAGCDDAEG